MSQGISAVDSVRDEIVPAVGQQLGAWSLRRGLLLLAIVMMLNQMDRLLLSALAEPIRRELQLSDTQVGLLTGLGFAVFYALCGVPLARLADRTDRPRLLGLCLLAWTLATSVCGLAANFVQLLVARVAVAVGEAGTQPAAHTLIADYLPRERRASALAFVAAGGSLGSMASLIFGGLLSEAFGWRASIVLVGLLGVPIAFGCWLMVPEPRRAAGPAAAVAEPAQSLWSAMKTLARSPTYVLLTVTATFSVLPGYAALTWAPSYFMRTFHWTVGQTGLWLGLLTGVGTLTGHALSGFLSDRAQRRGPGWVMSVPFVSVLLTGPALTLSFTAGTPTIAMAFYIAPLVLSIMWYAPVFASIQTTTPTPLRAQAAAITLLISNMFAIGAGPTLVGMISDMLRPAYGADSLRMALVIIVNITIVGAVGAVFAGRAMRRQALAERT